MSNRAGPFPSTLRVRGLFIVQLSLAQHLLGDLTSDFIRDTGAHARDLPLSAHALVFGALIAGLVLWLCGGKFIKPVIAALGIVLGGAVGYFVLPIFDVGKLVGIPSPFVGMTVGAILGFVGACLLFRVAMVVAGCAAFAFCGFMGGAIYLQYAPAEFRVPGAANAPPLGTEPSAPDSPGFRPDSLVPGEALSQEDIDRARKAIEDSAQDVWEQIDEDSRKVLEGVAESARRFAAGLRKQLEKQWDALSAADQRVLAFATLSGAAFGLLLGVLMPTKSAAVITALGGAAIWLCAMTWLWHGLDIPGHDLLHRSPMGWTFIWLVISTVGLMFQWTRAKRKVITDE